MPKIILTGKAVRDALLAGANILADAVQSTLGPGGRDAVLHRQIGFTPLCTRDGVTVAKEIDLPDPAQDAGAQMIRGAAERTVEESGDGTTTATVLARAIFREGLKFVEQGESPVAIKKALDAYTEQILAKITEMSVPVSGDAILHVATIAANNDPELGQIVADALRKVGASGIVTVEESGGFETTFATTEGMQIPSGWVSPYFITDAGRQECLQENANVLIFNGRLSVVKDNLMKLLKGLAQLGQPLFVIADEVEGPFLATLVVNKAQWNTCAIRSPLWGPFKKEFLSDMAIATGATVISEDLGLTDNSILPQHLGKAGKIVAGKNQTLILQGGGAPQKIHERADNIRTLISNAQTDMEKDVLSERLAKIAGGVAVIKVGASSRIEMGHKKARIEDAMLATRCAIEEGVVIGGGQALWSAWFVCRDDKKYASIFNSALHEPMTIIAMNAGVGIGANAVTGKVGDFMAQGVIDPAKVVKSALRNAVSVAGRMLAAETLIVSEPKETQKPRLPGQ